MVNDLKVLRGEGVRNCKEGRALDFSSQQAAIRPGKIVQDTGRGRGRDRERGRRGAFFKGIINSLNALVRLMFLLLLLENATGNTSVVKLLILNSSRPFVSYWRIRVTSFHPFSDSINVSFSLLFFPSFSFFSHCASATLFGHSGIHTNNVSC